MTLINSMLKELNKKNKWIWVSLCLQYLHDLPFYLMNHDHLMCWGELKPLCQRESYTVTQNLNFCFYFYIFGDHTHHKLVRFADQKCVYMNKEGAIIYTILIACYIYYCEYLALTSSIFTGRQEKNWDSITA